MQQGAANGQEAKEYFEVTGENPCGQIRYSQECPLSKSLLTMSQMTSSVGLTT